MIETNRQILKNVGNLGNESMKRIVFGLFIIGLVVGSGACQRQIVMTSSTAPIDGRYDLAFPFGANSDALEKVLTSVKLLNATAYYESYRFPFEAKVRLKDIHPDMLTQGGYPKTVYNDYAVGTATVIYQRQRRVAVLSCAHVVHFPDTVITYYESPDGNAAPYVYRIAMKKRQRHFIADLRHGEDFDILAIDHQLDVAILGKELLTSLTDTYVLDYPLGKATQLEWGSLLYLFGFPSGKKMITTGLVSAPNRNAQHGFLVDALFNRGFSGGLVLAIRDGYPNFELVGIVNAVAADNEAVLVPGEFASSQGDLPMNVPYQGEVFAINRKKINYGISFGIAIEAILEFMQKHRIQLENRGFYLEYFFKKPT